MALPAEKTLLVISTMGVPLYSARNLTIDITPIEQAKRIRRTVNMEARSSSIPAAQLYDIEIKCPGDVNSAPPAIDGNWPGAVFDIDVPYTVMAYKTATGTPGRTVVSGSSVVDIYAGIAGSFTRYRPRLTCMFVDFSMTAAEYQAGVEWSLKFTEQRIVP